MFEDRTVTLDDIAARCGVGRTTVHRALTGAPEISQATAERIRRTAEEMGYDPAQHDLARRMAYRKHGKTGINQVIALFFPTHFYGLNYFNRLFRGIIEETTNAHFDLLTIASFEEQPAPPHSIARGDVDGAIVASHPTMFTPVLQRLRALRTFSRRPIVSLLYPLEGCGSLRTDDYQGGYLTAAHLLDLGHRHLLHFFVAQCEENFFIAIQRVAGYRQAYLDRGLDPDRFLHAARLARHGPGGSNIVSPLLEAMRRHPEITGILAPNDLCAIPTWRTLTGMGKRVPAEVSLVGFDDIDSTPEAPEHDLLTTVHVPLEDIGRAAVRMLISQVRGEESLEAFQVLPVSLTIRQSTAPPPK